MARQPSQQTMAARANQKDKGFVSRFLRALAKVFLVPDPNATASPANASENDHMLTSVAGGDDVLYRAMDALHSPVLVVNNQRILAHANAEARDLFGQKVVGRHLAMFLRDPKALDTLNEVLGDGVVRSFEINLDIPIPRQYKVFVSRLSPIAHQTRYAILEFQDTTLIKRTENMRSEFIANVSHELRSPLATLIGFIETMQSAGDDPQDIDMQAQERFLGIMETEAHRMSRMIDDLLSLTNVELREHERPRDRVDITGVAVEVVKTLSARAQKHNVNIHLDCPETLPLLNGDRDQLVQVFHNLIVNAIKYGGAGGKVDVRVRQIKDTAFGYLGAVQVDVQDNGVGIAPEHLPRLTERFYRIDKGRSRAMGGTGLGLAIVKHIINRHRGRFQINSTLGKGSTFTIRLPIPDGSV